MTRRPVVAGDAVLDVDDVVADGEVAEVGDEGGGFGFSAAAGRAVTSASSERSCAPKRTMAACIEARIWTPAAMVVATMTGVRQVAGEVAGFGVDVGAARGFDAGAEAVGEFVLLQETGEAFDFALVGGGEQDAGVLLHQGVECSMSAGMEPWKRRVGRVAKSISREVAAVCVEDVDCAELVDVRGRRICGGESSRSQGER